jgi:hypothetical protein
LTRCRTKRVDSGSFFDGELIAAPSPAVSHQIIVCAVLMAVHGYLQSCEQGLTVMSVEFALSDDSRLRKRLSAQFFNGVRAFRSAFRYLGHAFP